MQINWESFVTYNNDARGIRYKFEDLCRQLFANENISGNIRFRYLHTNPNNVGLETQPVYNEVIKQWVGFQAKYFDHGVNYTDIKDSAEKIAKYYTGENGEVEVVYIFCNKPIDLNSKSYKSAIKSLEDNGIRVQLITDTAILDLVRDKYSYLGVYYFGNHSISLEWLKKHTVYMLEELGERYDPCFNIETSFMDELSLFVHDEEAVEYLNTKKKILIEKIEKLKDRSNKIEYLETLEEAVSELPDVDSETLYDSIEWSVKIKSSVVALLDDLVKERESYEKQYRDALQIYYDEEENQKERISALKKYQKFNIIIKELDSLINLPDMLSISQKEQNLLNEDVLIVSGKAGVGKSQLMACKMDNLISNGRYGLLLVAGIYFTDDPIHEQIMKNLGLDYSFDELIDILEAIGEKNNHIVPIFIDALNETWNRNLWRTGLPVIIDKIRSAPMVKLAISYRSEYRKYILPNSVLKGVENVVEIIHKGFEYNSIESIKKFLNHYNITITPMEYFEYEMTNPLFLKLYCKTYDGEEVNLPELYDKVLRHANKNIHHMLGQCLRQKGYQGDEDILTPLILEVAEWFVINNQKYISRKKIMTLDFWSEHDIAAIPFISQLVKEHIIHEHLLEQGEAAYYFAFDQMNDYYCAKAIISKFQTKEEIRDYLAEKVLNIHDGLLENSWNIDLFIYACSLYAERYDEECINIIDSLKSNDDKEMIFSKYIESFQWRKCNYAVAKNLKGLLNKYPYRQNDMWKMFIINSVKVSHPFNADFLHEVLLKYKLNERDYFWTVYINDLKGDDSNRVVQLISLYEKGENLDIVNEKQLELLLTLFGWFLSSSNRWLRDYTSKAMIEILKKNFRLCQSVLEKFKDVNDPYIMQRLYGVVFGACSKIERDEHFQALAEYVYYTVFTQEKVYPDILLRDYARLIVEKFLYEHSEYNGIIKRDKIVPPYNSDSIPEIEDQNYLEKKFDAATYSLVSSMRFEGMGLYGDFGRYVFQNALRNFDIDDRKMFNYAINYIFNELGYCEKYFGDYDKKIRNYDRFNTIKVERIGKKYQWITMYSMLARISDHCKMINRWNFTEEGKEVEFEGAWKFYIRDFDPTLNKNFMKCEDAPRFKILDEFIKKAIKENELIDLSSNDDGKHWLEKKGLFLDELKNTFILSDSNGERWVCLNKHCDTGHENINKLLVWSWQYAYFAEQRQVDEIIKCVENGYSVTDDTRSFHESYYIFNREYPWAPSCKELNKDAWIDVQLETGEYETIDESEKTVDGSFLIKLLKGYDWCQYSEEIPQRRIKKNIGKILHATTNLRWESEYDATNNNTNSLGMPCAELIELMDLRQQKEDGFYYDSNGKLSAFDVNLTQKINTVVVRKDILDDFLIKKDMRLIWIVDAGKEIHTVSNSISSESNWEGVFVYEGDNVTGEIYRLKIR